MRIIRSESFNSCFLDFLDKHNNRVAPVMDKLGFFEEVLERDGPIGVRKSGLLEKLHGTSINSITLIRKGLMFVVCVFFPAMVLKRSVFCLWCSLRKAQQIMLRQLNKLKVWRING
ncbi:hypothetical protein [Mesotoga sp. UBA5557]|jgi:hypothetical protein|uniref:hypothetical protein n=1 Tax=Mesotoga sp. UBA5557 TaxID=1946857 RepID=UPI0025F746A8|nr:hypothetical protein [Mesotoga sp. UBA5557]